MSGNTVIRTSSKFDNMVRHLGYEPIDYKGGTYRPMITDEELIAISQERLSKTKVVNDKDLSRVQLANLNLARAITDATSISPTPKVYAAILLPASDRVRTAGMYGKSSCSIYIAVDQLDHARNTVDTVIHEIAHHNSGAEDLERPHAEAMTKVAASVVELTNKGYFDNMMKNIQW